MLQHGRPVSWASALLGVGEIGHQHRGPLVDRVQARPFAVGELQFVVRPRASVPLEPRVPVLAPSKTSEIAAASTSSSTTHASHRRSAAFDSAPAVDGRNKLVLDRQTSRTRCGRLVRRVAVPQPYLYPPLVGALLLGFAQARRRCRRPAEVWRTGRLDVLAPAAGPKRRPRSAAPRASAHRRALPPTPLPLNRATVASSRTRHRHHRRRRLRASEPARHRRTRGRTRCDPHARSRIPAARTDPHTSAGPSAFQRALDAAARLMIVGSRSRRGWALGAGVAGRRQEHREHGNRPQHRLTVNGIG